MERAGVKGPIIIAMKGHPCTGKSALAWSLAQVTRCPIIYQDGVRDCIANLQHSLPTSPIEAAKHLDDLSFEAICRIAMRQLGFGIHLIIDSSLSCRAHLDRLLQISSSSGSHLVIVECKPQDNYEWQRRLECRAAADGTTSKYWYKPSTWEDLEKLLLEWCPDYDTGNVPKIVVNTTDHVKLPELAFAVQELAISSHSHSIEYHDFADKLGKGLVLTEGEAARNERLKHQEKDRSHRVHPHVLALSDDQNTDDDSVNCRSCLQPISGLTYKCMQLQCELRLHKLCAELPHKTEIKPQDCPSFFQATPPGQYSFPEIVRCGRCEAQNKDFNECHECLFESYIRSALLPSVLHHPCHEHPLCVKIVPTSNSFRSGFRCQACGHAGKYICYYCYECGFECHLPCGLLPRNFKQEHHRHPLTISFLPQEDESEEELSCHACETVRNPNHWIYYCAECEFACHLSCMVFAG